MLFTYKVYLNKLPANNRSHAEVISTLTANCCSQRRLMHTGIWLSCDSDCSSTVYFTRQLHVSRPRVAPDPWASGWTQPVKVILCQRSIIVKRPWATFGLPRSVNPNANLYRRKKLPCHKIRLFSNRVKLAGFTQRPWGPAPWARVSPLGSTVFCVIRRQFVAHSQRVWPGTCGARI